MNLAGHNRLNFFSLCAVFKAGGEIMLYLVKTVSQQLLFEGNIRRYTSGLEALDAFLIL